MRGAVADWPGERKYVGARHVIYMYSIMHVGPPVKRWKTMDLAASMHTVLI